MSNLILIDSDTNRPHAQTVHVIVLENLLNRVSFNNTAILQVHFVKHVSVHIKQALLQLFISFYRLTGQLMINNKLTEDNYSV